jgi:hypothetical protein
VKGLGLGRRLMQIIIEYGRWLGLGAIEGEVLRDWIGAAGTKTAYIERGSPWENGFIERFNPRLRDELLDGQIFYSLAEARIVIERLAAPLRQTPGVFIPAIAARAA